MLRKNNKPYIYLTVCFILAALMTFQAAAAIPGLTSDLSYNFSNPDQTEYYNGGTTQGYNITEDLPGYAYDIIDVTPQTVYNSDFGTNIILPGGGDYSYYPGNKPYNAPDFPYAGGSAAPQSNNNPSGSTGALPVAGIQETAYPNQPSASSQYPSFSYEDQKTNEYKITPIEQVRKSDGSIGALIISKIGLNITVYDGDTFAAMLKGAGHISSTSAWNGNIGIVGHNRGVTNNFGRLKELSAGDIIEYKTSLGTRKYKVTFAGKVSETDWSKLQYTNDNRITLVTCVENVPSQRLIIQGVMTS